MNLLESLPTVIGTAAVAPALLILWLVIAAGERPGPATKVWAAFLLGAASVSLLGAGARAVRRDVGGFPKSLGRAGPAFDLRGRAARGSREDPRHRRRLGAAPAVRRSDGYRALWRRRGAWFRGLRKPRLSRAACGDVAVAGGAAQRPDRAVPRRARHHRRRLSRARARRHRARRPPPSPRLGADLEPHHDPAGAVGAACRLRFPAADAAAKRRHRRIDPLHAGSGKRADRLQLDRICRPPGAAGRPSSRAPHRTRPRPAQPAQADVGAVGGGRRRRLHRPRPSC